MRAQWKITPPLLGSSQERSRHFRTERVTPEVIGRTVNIQIGNGKRKITIAKNQVGYKYGELALTKKFAIYKKKGNK